MWKVFPPKSENSEILAIRFRRFRRHFRHCDQLPYSPSLRSGEGVRGRGFKRYFRHSTEPQLADGLRTGFVHEAVLEDHPDLSGFDLYMSGPPPMIAAGKSLFAQAGLPAERLFYDSYDYAPDVIASILRGRAGIHG